MKTLSRFAFIAALSISLMSSQTLNAIPAATFTSVLEGAVRTLSRNIATAIDRTITAIADATGQAYDSVKGAVSKVFSGATMETIVADSTGSMEKLEEAVGQPFSQKLKDSISNIWKNIRNFKIVPTVG